MKEPVYRKSLLSNKEEFYDIARKGIFIGWPKQF